MAQQRIAFLISFEANTFVFAPQDEGQFLFFIHARMVTQITDHEHIYAPNAGFMEEFTVIGMLAVSIPVIGAPAFRH